MALSLPSIVGIVCALAVVVRSQEPSAPSAVLSQKPLFDAGDAWERSVAPPESGSAGRTPRLRLLGLPSGFLRDPLSGEEDEAAAFEESVLVNVGSYNPYVGWRRPSEPGVLGYSKFYSQLQILDLGETSVCIGLQALAPAGLESGGRAQGPTLLTPSLAWFHDLGEGVALHGFVGQDLQANSRLRQNLDRGLCCGLAWQYPLALWEDRAEQGVYFFVQALAGYGAEFDRPAGPSAFWEVVPGLHWRVHSDCWLSIGASRRGLLTWSWQF